MSASGFHVKIFFGIGNAVKTPIGRKFFCSIEITWYNFTTKGLGKRLIADVKNVIASIKQKPYFAFVKFDNIRTAACKTFPHAFIMKLRKQII